MTKENLVATAKELIASPSCYPPLREKAQAWVDAPDDKVISEAFIEEIVKDITPIDNLVEFANSARAVELFGEEGAKKFAAHANDLKADGAKYCDCKACTPALKILENREVILD